MLCPYSPTGILFIGVDSMEEAMDTLVSECPHHPKPKYRECYHIGDRFVVVYWGSGGFGGEGWLCTSGTIGKRGSITAWADKELDYMLAKLREKLTVEECK